MTGVQRRHTAARSLKSDARFQCLTRSNYPDIYATQDNLSIFPKDSSGISEVGGDCFVFDYPLLFQRDTLYTKIGLSPEASPVEIREAKNERLAELNRRRRAIEKRLAEVHKQNPDFEPARRDLKGLQQQDGQEAACSAATARLRQLEAALLRSCPDYPQLERELTEIDSQVNELNNIRLESPDERQKYDAITPPCALIKLARHEAPVLTDPRVQLHAIRREVAAFLEEEKNTYCFHPSDWTRRLFLSDYEHLPLLDEEMG
jgi:hypothetical protein